MSQEMAISDELFPRVRKAACGNQFEAMRGVATAPSRRRGEMLDAGKASDIFMFARAQRASKPFIASRRTARKGGDHPETKYGCGKRRTAIFCAVARRL